MKNKIMMDDSTGNDIKKRFLVELFVNFGFFIFVNICIFTASKYVQADDKYIGVSYLLSFVLFGLRLKSFFEKYSFESTRTGKRIIIRSMKWLVFILFILCIGLNFQKNISKHNGTNLNFVQKLDSIKGFDNLTTISGFIFFVIILFYLFTLLKKEKRKLFVLFCEKYLIYLVTGFILMLVDSSNVFFELIPKLIGVESNSSVSVDFVKNNSEFFNNNIITLINEISNLVFSYIIMLIVFFSGLKIRFKNDLFEFNDLIYNFCIGLVVFSLIESFIIICGVLVYLEFNLSYFYEQIVGLCWNLLMILVMTSKTIKYINSRKIYLYVYMLLSMFFVYLLVTINESLTMYIYIISIFILFNVVPSIVKYLSGKDDGLKKVVVGFNERSYLLFDLFSFMIIVISVILIFTTDHKIIYPVLGNLVLVLAVFQSLCDFEKTFICKFFIFIYYVLKNITIKINSY